MDQDKKDLKCGFCKQGKEVETECGKLWHDELQKCTAHKKCMQYSASLIQYKMRRFGGFKVNKVIKEIQRGKRLKCAVCVKDKKRRKIAGGATAGCALKRCKKTFHFCCAHKDKEAVTRRIEMTKASDVSVSYCVFCGEEHESEYFKSLNCKWVAKDTDSEGDNDDSYSESDSDQSDDDDDGTGSASDTNSRSSSNSSKKMDGDAAKGGQNRKPPPPSQQQQQQQQQPSGSGNNGTVDQKSKTGNQSGSTTEETNDAASNAVADVVSSGGTTEGRLETSGYNIVETTHDVLPEVPDNDTDANGNSVVNGNQAHVYGKRLSEEREEMEAKKSKVDGSMLNYSKDIVSGTDAFVVCFLEKRDQSDRNTRLMLEKSVDKLFHVPSDSIFLWHYNARPLNSGHVIYALNEISKALCQKNEDELLRLLFHFHDADISKFDSSVEHNNSLAVDIREELYANIRDQVSDNFAKAEQQYKRCVGKLCLVQPLSTYVGFVLLCNETDPMGVARAHVHGNEPVCFWDRSLVLAPPGDGQEVPGRGGLQEREYEKLSRYLKGIPVHCVHSWPKDAVLRVADQFSVTGRLHDRYACHPSSGGAHLVFLGPVDRSIMQYRLYIPKRINRIVDELLTAKHDVFCVLDVGPEVGLCSLDEIVPRLLPEIKMQAFTANDPKSVHASCAIIHFSISI